MTPAPYQPKYTCQRRTSARTGVAVYADKSNELAPVIRHFERTSEFLDLVGACHAFVATTNRVVPGLRGRTVCEDEKSLLGENIARVRAACEWIEHAVETGEVDVDEALTRLLRGE